MGEKVVDSVGDKDVRLGGDVCIEVSCCGSSVVTWVVGIIELLSVVWVAEFVAAKSYRQKSNLSATELLENMFIWILLPFNQSTYM